MWYLLPQAHALLGSRALDCKNLYADDFHVSDIFRFERSIARLGALLDLIESTGLVINLTKAQMLLTAKGPCLAHLLTRHTCRTKDSWFIRIPRRDGEVSQIRLVKQAVYLGIIISYRNMLDATMTSRIKSGRNAHRTLRKRLRGNHCLRQMDTPSPPALFDLPELRPLMAMWDASPHILC